MNREAATPGDVRRGVIAGVITFAVGLVVVLAVYSFAGSRDAGHSDPITEPASDTASASIAELEQFRSMMSAEEFDNLFGPAIRHEQENPLTRIMTAAEIDSLPAIVNRLEAPALTDADLARLAERVSVRSLNLGENPYITDDGMRHVAAIKGLESLYLGRTAVTDAGIRHLRGLSLTYINLWHTAIGDEALGYIAEMQTIQQLQIKDCPAVTDAGVARLAGLEHLWMVNLSYCSQITDDSIRTLSAMPKVEFIQILNCPNVSPRAISEFKDARPGRTIHH
jgi:hypothetical protein